jgi:Tannase and feruloyl esterase
MLLKTTGTALGVTLGATVLVACSALKPRAPEPLSLGMNPAQACAALALAVDATAIGLPTRGASMDSAVLTPATAVSVAPGGATPAGRINPATPAYCKVLGRIAPLETHAPPILFQINLPLTWNVRSVQYGGGGFNGTVTTGLGLVPAGRWDQPSPLAQGYVTYGTDSGHQNKPGEAPQAFATNPEALENFAHASYKKVRDVAVALTQRAYGRAPYKMYFMGSSEGGREALTMAQRYPNDFDGIFSRVPVINWTGLQHAGTRAGLTTQGAAWLARPQVELVHNAVLAACDALDGLTDGLIANPVACKQKFDVTRLQCGTAPAGACLSEPQIKAVQSLHSNYTFPFALANGITRYPGYGVSGEGLPAAGPTGGWSAWFVGNSAPAHPAKPDNGITWAFGNGALRYFMAQDPNADIFSYRPEQHRARIQAVSALMDSTNPDLSAFAAHGGKLMVLEHMADYAQSPYAGIGYFDAVVQRMGRDTVGQFARLYTAPGVDHVGSGAPSNVDGLSVLTNWVEQGVAPSKLTVVEQALKPPFTTVRELPLCEWPAWPQFRAGDTQVAASFECTR